MRARRRAAAVFAAAAVLGAATPAALRGQAEDATLVAFAIDTSGSLSPAEVAKAATLVSGVLGALPAGAEAALFAFDDQPRLLVPRTAARGDVAAVLGGLRRQGRFTALNDALYDATRYLRDAPAGRRALVVVTDGRDENSAVDLSDSLAVAQQAGIPVFTVGIGRVEERVLRRIAKLTGGQYAPLGAARAGQIAARIATLDVARAATAATTRAGGGDRRAETSPAPGTEGRETSSRRAAWITIGVVLAALAAVALWRRRRTAATAASHAIADDPAPTIVERMNRTEEYLEKTVTLRERPVLTITRGPGVGQVFELGAAALSIGRAKANEVVVNDVSVSSEHCRIRPEDGHYVLHDLKSTNGTFVNERRVSRHVLAEGDVIKLGETSLLFKTDLKRT
jgi:Mg-chelatase subunit ChlD